MYKISNQNETSQVANEINRLVGDNPESFTGDSIFWFGYRIASGQANRVTQAIGHVTPPPTTNQSVGSYDDIAINDATYLADAAQRIFKGAQAVIFGNTHPAGFKPSSYTTDIYNNSTIVYISAKRSEGEPSSIGASSILFGGPPPGLVNSGIQYGVYIESPIYNLNSSNHDVTYHFVQTILKDQSLLVGCAPGTDNSTCGTTNARPTFDGIKQVFGQIVLETALEGGQSSAQQALINIVDTVVADPSGSLSKTIFLSASEEASGNIAAANSGVKAIADNFAFGETVGKTYQKARPIYGSPTGSSSDAAPASPPPATTPPNPSRCTTFKLIYSFNGPQ